MERFPEYVPVAERKRRGARAIAKKMKKGEPIEPVTIDGRVIARTFWGNAWCDNLESYSDYENRMPRGRTYVRNGSVLHLAIEAGRVFAYVQGSELYKVEVKIAKLTSARWKKIVAACAGQIDSLVELLQGKLSNGVMSVVVDRKGGLFPAPKEIELACSCPDWADMCKHVAAALYGIGARLDRKPELLFALRGVDHLELIAAGAKPAKNEKPSASAKATIANADLAEVFGIDIDAGTTAAPVATPRKRRRAS